MAFKPRRNKDNGIEKVAKTDLTDFPNRTKEKPNSYSIPEDRNWRDQAIKALNILESKGINIYDTSRTPGMYLRKDNQISNSKNIKSFLVNLSENQSKQRTQQENTNNESKTPKNVFDFLCSK